MDPIDNRAMLPINEPIKEERTPYYDPARFYPARLGDVLNGHYQLATKLGYGSSSTVWLARDLHQWRWLRERYVAVKINASIRHSRTNASQAELDILKHISEANPHHKGRGFVRCPLDSFTVQHGSARHLSLVFEPLREPLWLYCERFTNDVIPADIFKILLQMILQELDYLHSECHVIHTDLKPDNIIIKIEDPSILEESARDEQEQPLPQKVYPDGRTIYLSRNNFGISDKATGIIQITDFDLSVRGDQPNKGCIQAEIYRAPEVILDVGYSYNADIWSLGVMLWDVLEGRKLFKEVDPVQIEEYDELGHLAHISALLGPPPKDLLDRGARTERFFELDGTFKGPSVDPAIFNFDNVISKIDGEEKRMFIEFVKRMLKWRPEERSTAKELLQDPWLYTDFDD
ncbi:kinase-like protein [Aspergillus terreus]|uniref:non-specific serine/threonine protein kinase n=1 Tax=Aspergillus terreus TaxID=33178 RepID=A0A5M3Z2D1_ASPTE|nr:hypothetical protein ATETN484_0005075000 [Aspergillus terreus]GFF17402.1 kinase-like protein [Aspergillus terreus]